MGTNQPSSKSFILINEPDLKLGPMGGAEQMRALVSALDGALDAEREAGVVNPKLKFTAAFSFAVCNACRESQKPALGQMLQLRDAMKDPSSVGYTAKNDLWEAYTTRFENSFNTANPSRDLKPMILDDYNREFKDLGIPIFIGEYHTPDLSYPLEDDLKKAMALTDEAGTLFAGLSFIEWQPFDIWCLEPVDSVPSDVAAAYGGQVPSSQ